MARRTQHPWPVIVATFVVACLVSCGVTATDAEEGRGGDIPGGVVTDDGPAETRARDAEVLDKVSLDVEGADDSDLNLIATTAIADLESFWEEEYPRIYDDEYEPLAGGLFAYDFSSDPRDLPCTSSDIDIEDMMDNAYYCPPEDAVAWDQEMLMPRLASEYGEFTVAVVLAHEWGHVIQDRIGRDAASVYTELQADCFAGAWVRHVHDADPTPFLIDAAVLDQALAGVLSLQDAPGSLANDPMAHGSGFDRVGAFQDGYLNTASACEHYLDEDFTPYQFPFNDEDDFDNEGNLPLDGEDGIQELGISALEAFWSATYPEVSRGKEWQPLEDLVVFDPDDPPTCNGTAVDGYRLLFCQPERWIGYTTGLAEEAYERDGDFGLATLIGTQYGLAVQDALGDIPDDVAVLTQRGDCYTGAWAGAMVPDRFGQTSENYGLVLSPGDLDEAVSVLLGFRSESDRVRQGPAFDRVTAFRTGVLEGAEACGDIGA